MSQTALTVINPVEGRRFRMSLSGDASRLPVRKLKAHLVSSSGIETAEQLLKYNGVELPDDLLCGEVGITSGSTLTIERRTAAGPYVASPHRHHIELETLEQQRATIHNDRARRDDDMGRRQESILMTVAEAERRRNELEREQKAREAELQRVRLLEAEAHREQAQLNALRAAEAEREAARARDIEDRKRQLHSERDAQRQLEMQRLENERKKMLLAQQRTEYENERARLEQERNDYYQRRRQQEVEIREKECDLERQELEAERVRRELEQQKALLHQQRVAETSHFAPEGSFARTPVTPSSMRGRPASTPAAPQEVSVRSIRVQEETSIPRTNAPSYTSDIIPQTQPPQGPRAVAAVSQPPSGLLNTPSTSRNPSQALDIASRAASSPMRQRPAAKLSVPQTMEANLQSLAAALGLPRLVLDDNNTCVVSYSDRCTLLITFDAATERLYLYSTLATAIPKDTDRRLRLYEFLLEGALLGRDMCGGGVGASLKNDFILMSSSLPLAECGPAALAALAPPFVESLMKWRARLRERGLIEPEEEASRSMARGQSAASQASEGAYRSLSQLPPSAVIGVEVSDGEVVAGNKVQYNTGVLVVSSRGPAQRAGILPQDFILSVDGAPINSLEAFRSVARSLRPHASVPFVIDRAGTQLTLNVLVGSSSF